MLIRVFRTRSSWRGLVLFPAAAVSWAWRRAHPGGNVMDYENARIEEAVLALLAALNFNGGQCWKGYDFGVMDALFERGLITDPRSRNKSVWLTDEGLERGRAAAQRLFGDGGSAT